jgi:hypothetical protein
MFHFATYSRKRVMVKLTKLDRENILALARIYDAWNTVPPQRGIKVSFFRHQELLLKYGFEYGMSSQSMFGVDNEGRTWQITSTPRDIPSNPHMSVTIWYRIDERGLRHKITPSLTWEAFHNLFGENKK